MPEGPLDLQRRSLGERRLTEHMEANALVQFNALALNMSIHTAPQADYSDVALEAIKVDAADLRRAADAMATRAEELADHWRAQREEATRG